MSQRRNVLKLDDPDETNSWLTQHLPNRVCAAWVRLPEMKGEWRCKQERQLGPADFANVGPNEVWCICRAVEHGRKAAMRWLIEFVGIDFDDKTGKPGRPKRCDKDVSIQSFVAKGSELDLQIALDISNPSPEACILADVWKGCTQSSVHSTFGTNHPPEDPAALAKAFSIIVEHLQAKLYGPRDGKRFSEIVREQQ